MSLSDCPECWDTPCSCGYEYERMKLDRLKEVVDAATRVYQRRAADGDQKFKAKKALANDES